MNNERRNKLDRLVSDLEAVKSVLEELKDEEQEYYDNIPESLKGSERGSNAYEAVNKLEEAAGNVSDAIDAIAEVISG